MELINKHLLNLANITKYGIILKRQINDNKPISDIMSFENFSLLTKEVINTIINNIPDTTNNKETYSCQIKPNIKYTGYFDSQNNQIIISKESIKKIYQGDILKLLIIFEKLAHLKIKFEIKSQEINEHLVRCIKELLLKNIGTNYLKINNYNIVDSMFDSSFSIYYRDNEKLFSKNLVATLESINTFVYFINHFDIKLSQRDLKFIQTKLTETNKYYNNYLRDVRYNFAFGTNYIDFEAAFDIAITQHKEWLEIPQLQIEYYLDRFGNVKKRTFSELNKLLKSKIEEKTKDYITHLLKGNQTKKLTKKDFYKIDYLYYLDKKSIEKNKKKIKTNNFITECNNIIYTKR